MKSKVVRQIILILVLLFALSFFLPSKTYASVTCGSAEGGITVAASHGQAFYIDTSTSPVLDAGYIGYRVTNGTGSTQAKLWVKVSNFTGGVISLANTSDMTMLLSNVANNATTTAYFLLKATGATTNAQTHKVEVFNTNPDLSGSTPLYTCTYSFSKVVETSTANSNKIINTGYGTSSAIEVSNTNPELGQTIVISVEGQTGTIGSGVSPDGSLVWLSPASVSSWPTRALRLESVSVTFERDTNVNRKWTGSGDTVTYTNQLIITNAQNCLKQNANTSTCTGGTGNASAEYRAFYTFRVVGRSQTTIKAVPIPQIASGTQIKHADVSAAINLSFPSLSLNATLSKTVPTTIGLTTCTPPSCSSITGGVNGTTYVAVPYRLTAASTATPSATLDELVDTPGSGVIFQANSATITDIGRTAVSISDPVYLASESSLNPRPYHFTGPFTFNSSTSAVLNYYMWVPVGTSINTAYGKIGDILIGANSSAMSKVTVVPASDGTTTVSVSTQTFPVVATTDTATSITSTGATLNATVDPNGNTPLTGTFEYGLSPSLSGATTVTATTP